MKNTIFDANNGNLAILAGASNVLSIPTEAKLPDLLLDSRIRLDADHLFQVPNGD